MKKEWGAIIALALAVIGFAFWLGGLESKVTALQTGSLLENQKTQAVSAIDQAAQTVMSQDNSGPIARPI